MTIDLSGWTGEDLPVSWEETVEVSGDYQLTANPVLSFTGRVCREGNRFRLEGEGRTVISAFCHKCLAAVTFPLDIPVSEVFAAETAGEDETEPWPLTNGRADLSEPLRVNLLAALPLRVLCRPDCRGLCPRCGQNLNEKDCGCPKGEPDPRFAALRELRVDDREHDSGT